MFNVSPSFRDRMSAKLDAMNGPRSFPVRLGNFADLLDAGLVYGDEIAGAGEKAVGRP